MDSTTGHAHCLVQNRQREKLISTQSHAFPSLSRGSLLLLWARARELPPTRSMRRRQHKQKDKARKEASRRAEPGCCNAPPLLT